MPKEDGSRTLQKGLFDPVSFMLRFGTYDKAIEKANDVTYRLGSFVRGRDVRNAMIEARDLRFRQPESMITYQSDQKWLGSD